VVGTNVTIRFNDEELRRLDELAQRMGKTRSDVIRDLINRFDEALRGEVERERGRWMLIGFTAALEEVILDPTLMLRFVRRNVDVLGFPDFLIGMVKVRNRVVVFSHHDKIGHQLLQQVRSKLEEEVRREEAEIEREEVEDEDSEGGRAAPMRIRASRPAGPDTIRVAPVATKYRIMISNRSGTHIPKPTAANTVGRPIISNGGGSAKSTAAASVSKNQKAGSTGIPTSTAPADSQPKDSGPRVSADGGGANSVRPVDQGLMGSPRGDFVFALIANSYHKHRDKLLRLMGSIAGD
jgi:hypothetical protein